MEDKDPMYELLSSLEQIVFKDDSQRVILSPKLTAFTEFEQLRNSSGMQTDEFARAMGVSVAMVQEWESRREKPSPTELKLMRLLQPNPIVSEKFIA